MECDSVIKGKEVLMHAAAWMSPSMCCQVKEASHKGTSDMEFYFYKMSRIGTFIHL